MGAVLGAVGAGVGGLGGLIGGVRGTPEQNQNTTSQTTFAPKSSREQQLLNQSRKQYEQGVKLAGQYEGEIGQYDPLQQAAIQQQLGLLSGEAFGLTPQEMEQLNMLRSSMVQQGSADVNKMLDERLRQSLSHAAGRGLRGQALAEIQGRVIDSGAEELGRIQNQANQFYAQQAINTPLNRINAQAGAANTGLNIQQILQQQAIQNRNALQNPFALQAMMEERMRSGVTTGNQNTPGQGGGFWGGVQGLLGGVGGGLSAGANAGQAINNLQLSDQYTQLANKRLSDARVAGGVDTAADWA